MEPIAIDWNLTRRTYSVTELNEEIREVLGEAYSDIWVAGELSGVKLASSGHYYFTLKDAGGALRCACWKQAARLLRFKPQEGMAVLARGRIDVYAPRGDYQLIVETMQPQGHGALQFAFEQLKKRLTEEGLFDPERKRDLPVFPRRIGIVTSPTGAVIQDMLQVLERRHPGLHIRVYPALVQGAGSIEEVCRGLHYFALTQWADVIVVARGGGSLEDLWTFNEEEVARAIAASPVPVISAIGHETDFTIADFVADLRAPTPSAAAELLIAPKQQFLDKIANLERCLAQGMHRQLTQAERRWRDLGVTRATNILQRKLGRQAQRVDELEFQLRDRWQKISQLRAKRLREGERKLNQQDLKLRLAKLDHRLETANTALHHWIGKAIHEKRCTWQPIAAELAQLSPLRVLDRGYALVETESGAVVRAPGQVGIDTELRVRVAQGEFRARVTRDADQIPQ